MKQITIMLKPASSACNLRCRYCFYADLAGKRDTFCFGSMSDEAVDRILATVGKDLEPGDRLTFAFQGGEPTLVGLPWFEKFVEKARPLRPAYALQTNGTLLDEAWGEFLRENGFLVGLSLDGMPRCHNAARVDVRGEGTYDRVMEAVRLLRKHRVEFNILCTLTADIARHPNQVWNWICKNGFPYVQFTPCMDELDAPGQSPWAVHPKLFASFYQVLFRLWLRDFQKGRYRSIKFFDDVVNLLAYGCPTACGIHGQCQCQLVVEADGSTYPCDFYCLDKWKLGNLQEDSFLTMLESPRARAFLCRPREEMQACGSCPYLRFCAGGCRRMQREIYCAPGENFCGYRAFLDEAMPALRQIALEQRRYAHP